MTKINSLFIKNKLQSLGHYQTNKLQSLGLYPTNKLQSSVLQSPVNKLKSSSLLSPVNKLQSPCLLSPVNKLKSPCLLSPINKLKSSGLQLPVTKLKSSGLQTLTRLQSPDEEGWPTFNLILLIGDTTAPSHEGCCREGWPPLLLLFLLDCSVCHVVSLLVVHACLHPSSAHESRLHLWELVRTVSSSFLRYPLLLRFITSTNFVFDKRLWFS